MATTLYFDESGYTGYDLLNPDQPIFVVASTTLTNAESGAILRDAFPRYQGAEFKFSRVWNRPRYRRELIDFSRAIGNVADQIFVYWCEKKFTALTKIVDILVEPLVYDAGYDFYAEGFNRGYVNMLHFALMGFAEPSLYDVLVRTYDRFSRAPSPETLAELKWYLRLIANSCGDELRPFLDMIAAGAELYEDYHSLDQQRASNDIHVTCVLTSVYFWRTHLPDEFEIVQDASSHFFRQIDRWEQITSSDVMPGIVTSGDGREVHFPLRVTATHSGDSAASFSLQLCDLIAGLAAKLKNPSERDADFLREISLAGFGELQSDGIRPEFSFIEGEPAIRAGGDSIDQFLQIISNRRQ